MKISFHGAARMVTGSKHIIHLKNGKKVLLDCGLFQGMGEETFKLNSSFGFAPDEISYVIISHAHIDHTGLLPKLVKEGYNGKIFCTPATADLTSILLQDSAFIQESDIAFVNKKREKRGQPPIGPLYTVEDAKNVLPLLTKVPYNQVFQIDDDISFHYTDTGHILGSAAVHVTIKEDGKETVITFSGDVGRYRDVILCSPESFPHSDYILIESTYGDSFHEDYHNSKEDIYKHIVETCVQEKGKLIIPAFSVGRTQELLFALNQLELEGRLPNIPYYVDSPLSSKSTEIIKKHPELFNKRVQRLMEIDKFPFDFKGLKFIEDVNESKSLNSRKDPMVIISASGMAEAGRVKHHIANNIENTNCKVLLTGFCSPNTLGYRLLTGAKEVRIFSDFYKVKCKVASIKSMSAHGDYDDLSQFLACQNPDLVKGVFVVHGEYDVQVHFQSKLQKKGFKNVNVPAMHQTIQLD
ncbi:MAG: MBL fold metallo-hydrolase [Chitinophagaceae bacterium]|nr:MAG: RNA-metabolising metallo-beta-lactamase [Bacteroidetes bacterium OLB11]MCC6447213.1 MBL fold metallo-hydrolase [Chitinophagaceae bacterium]HMN32223.1 MBL fold metallo-hydrolase [Chitinophagaceae bacterium]